MFKYEMHMHTVACSPCAVSRMSEYVYKAKETGYAGFVITNHFNFRIRDDMDPNRVPELWREYVERYENDWQEGYELGRKEGIDVLFGVEAGIGHGKEALIYGLSPDDFKNETEFPYYSTAEKSAFVHRCGGWFVAAHPFRHRNYIAPEDAETPPEVELYDALEVYNEGNLPGENPRAETLALENGLSGTGGGDVHDVRKFGNSGMAFETRILSNDILMRELRAGRYRIIIRGRTDLPIE